MGMKRVSGTFPNLKTKEASYDKVSSDSPVKVINMDLSKDKKSISNIRSISLDSNEKKTSDDIKKNEASSDIIKNDKANKKPEGELKTDKSNTKRAQNKAKAINRNSDKSKFIELRKEAKKVVTKKQLREFLKNHKEFEISPSLQNVHRPGTDEFKENKSIVFGSISKCQRLTMKALRRMKMSSDNFILVHSITTLGVVTTTTGEARKTRYAKLHYGKHGAHIVPVIANLKNWRKIK